MIDVTVLLFEGGHASTSVGPIEVFSDAGALWNVWIGKEPRPLFRVRTATASGKAVTPHGPYQLVPDCAIADIERTDLVYVPSTGLELDTFVANNQDVIAWLKDQREKGARIAGVCAGVALLGEAGFLNGRRATTHWGLVEEYRRRYPEALWNPDVMVTEQDDIYTGAGVHAALDLALYLVEKLGGHFHAVQTAKSLLIDMPRSCQSSFAIMPLGRSHQDAFVRRAEDLIHERYAEDLNLDDLARDLGMSQRNFIRRFKEATGEAPRAYIQKLRIAVARQLLEEDHKTVQEIASAVGYEDIAFFRQVFRRHTGTSPAAYREQFGVAAA